MSTCQSKTYKLEVKNIYKSYKDTHVLNNISINLNDNEFVSLIGPSGSGKSTIFNIIAGLLKPDKGHIYIEGKDCTGETGKISYMYQKDLLLPWKKIIDNVALPFIIKGDSKKEAREKVSEYFDIFGLEGFEYKYPFQLSGGMRQRAALMRTYMFSKDIILLDEPFGGLDAITKTKMQHWLLKIFRKLKASILFITHDIEEAVFLSDRIYILSDRPASIKKEVFIGMERPRVKEIITTKNFNSYKKQIINLI